MKHIKIFEKFSTDRLEAKVAQYIKYPGMTFDTDSDNNVAMKINGEYAGEYRFSGVYNNYITAEVIFVEPRFKRKGIYTAVIKGAMDYAKTTKNIKGIASYPFDADGMDIERSAEANAFWEGMVRKGLAVRKEGDEGPEYFTK